jgi:hypothetical protein
MENRRPPGRSAHRKRCRPDPESPAFLGVRTPAGTMPQSYSRLCLAREGRAYIGTWNRAPSFRCGGLGEEIRALHARSANQKRVSSRIGLAIRGQRLDESRER